MNRKSLILSSVCVILLIALVGGTLAWFYINQEVSVNYGNSIFCEAGDSLEISLINENGNPTRWSGSIDYSAGEFTAVDISGDGCYLYRPAEIDENQNPINLLPATSTLNDRGNYDYIEMVVAFRSVSKMNVYLSEESFIQPVDTSIPDNPNDPTANIYGRFSRDYIAGAMRVAVVGENDEDLRMLWAPNSKYELIDNLDGTYNFKEDSIPESAYYFYGEDENGDIVLQNISSDLYANKKFVVDSTGAKAGDTGNSPVLVSLNPTTEGVPDMKVVKIRIWFEGTDREAHQALAGGNVKVQLKFIGIAKETDEDKQTVIDNITFDQNSSRFAGLSEGMVFSTDGRTWSSVAPDMAAMESGSSVYIKYPETATHYETSCRKFTKD